MEFSRPEYWRGQPFPSSGDLPNPEIEPRSPTLQAILYKVNYQGPQQLMLSHLVDGILLWQLEYTETILQFMNKYAPYFNQQCFVLYIIS